MKTIIPNKRGQLGLGVVKAVMVTFLILAVIAIAILLATGSIKDVVETTDTTTVTVVNETFAVFGTTPASLAYLASDTYRVSTCTSLVLVNGTGVTIPATNYTTTNSGCTITGIAGSLFNNTAINASYTAKYANPESNQIVQNLSDALTNDFFDQTGTIFAILIVVVIILAIAIIIIVVARFNAGGSVGGGSRSYGSDTMMGV